MNMLEDPSEEELYGLALDANETSSPSDDSENYVPFGSVSKEIEFNRHSVTELNECLTHNARRLCILDSALKFMHEDHYDIGGTYLPHHSGVHSELWFYCTSSYCVQSSYILNVFFRFRKGGSAAIGISDANTVKKQNIYAGDTKSTYLTLPETLTWKTFKSSGREESHYLKTYCFSREDIQLLRKKVLCIPIKINTNFMKVVDRETLQRIKIDCNLTGVFKRRENTDFVLESTSGSKFDVHKILLAAHSSVLRNDIRNSDSLVLAVDDSTMELFLEHIYNGTIQKNLEPNSWSPLIQLALQYKLDLLLKGIEHAIVQQIDTNNATDIAMLAEEHNLATVDKAVLAFVKSHPKVMFSDGWKNLKNVTLMKKLFQVVYHGGRVD